MWDLTPQLAKDALNNEPNVQNVESKNLEQIKVKSETGIVRVRGKEMGRD